MKCYTRFFDEHFQVSTENLLYLLDFYFAILLMGKKFQSEIFYQLYIIDNIYFWRKVGEIRMFGKKMTVLNCVPIYQIYNCFSILFLPLF